MKFLKLIVIFQLWFCDIFSIFLLCVKKEEWKRYMSVDYISLYFLVRLVLTFKIFAKIVSEALGLISFTIFVIWHEVSLRVKWSYNGKLLSEIYNLSFSFAISMKQKYFIVFTYFIIFQIIFYIRIINMNKSKNKNKIYAIFMLNYRYQILTLISIVRFYLNSAKFSCLLHPLIFNYFSKYRYIIYLNFLIKVLKFFQLINLFFILIF